jgi:hypothetical protein
MEITGGVRLPETFRRGRAIGIPGVIPTGASELARVMRTRSKTVHTSSIFVRADISRAAGIPVTDISD